LRAAGLRLTGALPEPARARGAARFDPAPADAFAGFFFAAFAVATRRGFALFGDMSIPLGSGPVRILSGN
jgi:hypothetical protein